MNYYLNAFNEMLRKRQENQMGGGSERSANPQFDAMSNTQKADYYSNNPTMAAITQGLQKGFGMTGYGMLQNAMYPDFVREQQAIAQGFPSAEAYSGSRNFGKESSLPAGGVVSPGMPQSRGMFESFLNDVLPSSSVSLGPPASIETRTVTPNPNYDPTVQNRNFFESYLNSVLPSSSVSLGPPAPVETRTPTLNPDAVAAMTGYGDGMGGGGGGSYGGPGGAGFGGGSQAFNQGGMVKAQHLMGRAPAPDDGYGALQGGEYVITKAAVEKYGKAMMDAINNGTFR